MNRDRAQQWGTEHKVLRWVIIALVGLLIGTLVTVVLSDRADAEDSSGNRGNCSINPGAYPECLAPDSRREARQQIRNDKWGTPSVRVDFFRNARPWVMREIKREWRQAKQRVDSRLAVMEEMRVPPPQDREFLKRWNTFPEWKQQVVCLAKGWSLRPHYCTADRRIATVPSTKDWNRFGHAVDKLTPHCNAAIVSGVAGGAAVSWYLGPGVIAGALGGGTAAAVGCVAANGYNWIRE